MSFIVAIDGPAGSGKGSITKVIAEKMKLSSIDTGAMYRCVTLNALRKGIDPKDSESVIKTLDEIDIVLDEENQKVFLNGDDVTSEIRSVEVTNNVSYTSAIKEVRLKLVEMQRKIARDKDIIMEGRDITTVVFPNADVKIYLDASVEERAKRRFKQNQENGIEATYEEILESIKARDYNDMHKEFGALVRAEDAIYIDSSDLTIKQVTDKIIKIIKEKKKEIRINDKVYEEKPDGWFKTFQLNLVRKFMMIFYYIPVFRIQSVHKERVPKEGAYIICANHVNMLDALAVVCSNKRKIRFVCKHSMFKNKWFAWALKSADTIPIDRDKNDIEAMKRIIKGLKNGDLLGIFPEGTRKGMEKNMKAKNGAAFFALKSGVKVIPLGIQGSFKPFTKVRLVYGEPLDFSEYYGKEKDKEALDKVTDIIMDNIVKLTNESK